MVDDDIQILEPGDYTGGKDETYSHPRLVMFALRDVMKKRSVEMRDGYWNTKFDRLGNPHRVWIPDSREEFIESVDTLMMIQERDYDDDAIKEINKIKEKLNEKFKKYCEEEKKTWNRMDYRIKIQHNKNGDYFIDGRLSKALPFKFEYVRDKVDSYTKIVSVIQKLIKRQGDYGEEWITA